MVAPVSKASDQSSLRASVKDQSGAGKLKIGEILRKEGLITTNQLEEALAFQKKSGGRLGNILIRLGYIEENTILNVLSRVQNFPAVSIRDEPPSKDVLALMPYAVARKYMAFPLRTAGKTLHITMSEPTDTSAVESLQADVKMALSVSISMERDIVDAYRKYYKISDEEYAELTKGGEVEKPEEDEGQLTSIDDFGALA